MKAIIRQGKELLFCEGASNKWENLKDEMIINFKDKYNYLGFQTRKNRLFLLTESGEIEIAFSGELPKFKFNHYEKNQLVLTIKQ